MSQPPIAAPEPSSSATGEPTALSVTQLARRWGVATSTVRKWIRAGVLPAFRVGHRVRVWTHEADRFERRI